MRCTFTSQSGTPCRARARRGATRCRHHAFSVRMANGDAVRPSLLDAYLECPARCKEQYFSDAQPGATVPQTPSRAALFGTVGHDIIAAANLAYQASGTWELSLADAAERACGQLTASEIEDLIGVLGWYRPSYSHESIVFCEPTMGHGTNAEPTADWKPRWYFDLEWWGTPDLVTREWDSATGSAWTIHDWKFGRVPTDPRGAAPIVYAWLLSEWHREEFGSAIQWPVRIVWRWMRQGADAGTRERLLYAEDVAEGMGFLSGVAASVTRSLKGRTAGGDCATWPAVPNEYCGFCPLLETCALECDCDARTVAGITRRYMLEVGLEKAAHNCAEVLRVQLAQLVAAGEDIADPDTGEALFTVNLGTRHTHSRLTADSIPIIADACREAGVPIAEVLRLDGSRLQSKPRVLERLVEAGVSTRTAELAITRARNGKVGS